MQPSAHLADSPTVETLARMITAWMRSCGFRRATAGSLEYWYRPALSKQPADETPLPIVFFHGVMGLMPYGFSLRLLARHTPGAVLLPVFHISALDKPLSARLRPEEQPQPPSALLSGMLEMIERHHPTGEARATIFAHSLGTGVAATFLKRLPGVAASAVLIDPICFDLSSGEVLHNFLYARPSMSSFMHLLQRSVGTLEPSVQYCFHRVFWWTHNILDPEELTCDTVVVLGGEDTVSNASSVHACLARWLRGEGKEATHVRIEWTGHWTHGGLFQSDAQQERLIRSNLIVRESAGTRTCASDSVKVTRDL